MIPEDVMIMVQSALLDEWRELRNDHQRLGAAMACVQFAARAGLLTLEAQELWELRFKHECPGHDDEGGRVWCAYCGDLPNAKATL